MGLGEQGDGARLLTGNGQDRGGAELARAVCARGGDGRHTHAAGAHPLAQAQEEGAALVLGLEGHQEHLPGPLQRGVGHLTQARARDPGGEEEVLLLAVVAHALVDVVGAHHLAGEAGPGPAVLQGGAGAGQQGDAAAVPRLGQALGGHVERIGPGGGHQLAGLLIAHERDP